MTDLPEPTIIVDMDMMENQVYDSGDLAKYGRAEYLRAIENAAKFFELNDTNMFWGSQAAAHIRELGSKT